MECRDPAPGCAARRSVREEVLLLDAEPVARAHPVPPCVPGRVEVWLPTRTRLRRVGSTSTHWSSRSNCSGGTPSSRVIIRSRMSRILIVHSVQRRCRTWSPSDREGVPARFPGKGRVVFNFCQPILHAVATVARRTTRHAVHRIVGQGVRRSAHRAAPSVSTHPVGAGCVRVPGALATGSRLGGPGALGTASGASKAIGPLAQAALLAAGLATAPSGFGPASEGSLGSAGLAVGAGVEQSRSSTVTPNGSTQSFVVTDTIPPRGFASGMSPNWLVQGPALESPPAFPSPSPVPPAPLTPFNDAAAGLGPSLPDTLAPSLGPDRPDGGPHLNTPADRPHTAIPEPPTVLLLLAGCFAALLVWVLPRKGA